MFPTLLTAVLGGLMLVSAAVAQQPAPVGIVRGEVALLLVRAQLGTLDLQTTEGPLYQCDFDGATYIERANERVRPNQIQKGDVAEVIVDRKKDRPYARIIRIVENRPPIVRAARLNSKPRTMRPLELFPRGNLTFAGVLLGVGPHSVILRTRSDPRKVILLREDTRFFDSGLPADPAKLHPNTRVFVRGGRTLEGDLEAFQIVWGEIEGPKSSNHF